MMKTCLLIYFSCTATK